MNSDFGALGASIFRNAQPSPMPLKPNGSQPLPVPAGASRVAVAAEAIAVPTVRFTRFALTLPFASAIFQPHHCRVPFTLLVPGPICAALAMPLAI